MKKDEVDFTLDATKFDHDPDLSACIVAGKREGGFSYVVVMNPSEGADEHERTLEWCAGLLTRIEEHGFDAAMQIDGWQLQSDGDFQLWARGHLMPS